MEINTTHRYYILLLFVCLNFVLTTIQAQQHQLIHSNTYSTLATGESHLNYLKSDSIFVYELNGSDFTSFPANFGLWEDEFVDNIYEVDGKKCVFLDHDWNMLGVFEVASGSISSSTTFNWIHFNEGIVEAVLGNGYEASFDVLPYPINGNLTNLNYNWIRFGYDTENQSLSPRVSVKQDFQIDYGQNPFIVSGYGYNFHQPVQSAVKLNDSESIFITPYSGGQSIYGEPDQTVNTINFGYNWFKINDSTNEYELASVSSDDDLIVYHGIYESKIADRYYGVKTIRGDSVAFDTSGDAYDTNDLGNRAKCLITLENADGIAEWTAELYDYSSLFGDSLGEYILPSLRNGNLVELDNSVVYSQSILFPTSNQNEVLYYSDFFDNNQTFSYDSNSLVFDFPGSTDQYGIFGKSMLYGLDIETGNKIASLEIEGSQYTWSYYPPGVHAPGASIYQEPKVFQVGDSLAWVNEFYANNDTIIQFLKKTNGGDTEEFSLSLQAGYSTIIAWINSDLSITDYWVIPVTLGDSPDSRGLRITEMMMLGQDSILVHGYLEAGITTNMDPAGLADLVVYPDYRTSFLGVYAPDFSSDIKAISKSLGFEVFPNPATHTIQIAIESNLDLHYTILDVSGRILQNGNLPKSSQGFTVDINSLNAGMYLLQVQSGNEMGVKKFIVK